MASEPSELSSSHPKPNPNRPRPLLNAAISENSIPKLESALNLARSTSPSTYDNFLDIAFCSAVSKGSIPLTTHLLKHENALVSHLSSLTISSSPSIPLLEVLLAHGWDINHQDRKDTLGKGKRLLDRVLQNEELVRWLVEHGARLDGEEQDLDRLEDWPAPLLESCAALGSLSTFKFLQERGAKLGRRTLHRAAGAAAAVGAGPGAESTDSEGSRRGEGDDDDAEYRQQRELILRYLVDELGLDVNQMDTDVPRGHLHYGSPLNYAAKEKNGIGVVKWLMAKGADPAIKSTDGGDLAMDAEGYAAAYKCEENLEAIREWMKNNK
ncbi:hypothetical protein K469DRAFT_702328 [Zopfia rhizophila CBS 207.26]|uniref:Ankyrin n=1 Tax=Zopfia rhizophila CBS 207.26 TaxID=1314779 RepID=A0A6A6DBG8_9PEZI|nr:hypothetical protein K469DRAFT_702328 [Zopfia rhizophila CBS 207.26]